MCSSAFFLGIDASGRPAAAAAAWLPPLARVVGQLLRQQEAGPVQINPRVLARFEREVHMKRRGDVPTFETSAAIQRERKTCWRRGLHANASGAATGSGDPRSAQAGRPAPQARRVRSGAGWAPVAWEEHLEACQWSWSLEG